MLVFEQLDDVILVELWLLCARRLTSRWSHVKRLPPFVTCPALLPGSAGTLQRSTRIAILSVSDEPG